MATHSEHKLGDEEPKIPVFTVLKNGAILKNIFIVSSSDHDHHNPKPSDQEQILNVGRHPDCNIMLTHPSISRFHLQIISNHSLHKLCVIDLSSVHGTWVSEKRVEPWARVELREGDSLRIGGSSRVYRLHWIPLSQAYDFESTYELASDASLTKENGEVSMETYRDEISLAFGNEPAEEEENTVTKEEECQEIPSALLMPKNLMYSLLDDDKCIESSLKDVDEQKEVSRCDDRHFRTESGQFCFPFGGVIPDSECAESGKDSQSLGPSTVTGAEKVPNHLVAYSDISLANLEKSDLVAPALEETENQHLFTGYFGQSDKPPSLVGEVIDDIENHQYYMSSSHMGRHENSTASHDEVPPASEKIEGTEDQKLSLEHHEQKKHVSIECYTPYATKTMNSHFVAEEVFQEISDDKENQTPQDDKVNQTPQSLYTSQSETIGNSPIRPEKTPGYGSIWSRRGKPANDIQLRMGRSRGESLVDGVNPEDEQHDHENMQDKRISKDVFFPWDGEEVESFTLNKENYTPNTLLLKSKSLKKKGKLASVGPLRTGTSGVSIMRTSADSAGEQHNQENIEDKSISKEPFSCLYKEEEEKFASNKEFFTTNTLPVRSLKKKDKFTSNNLLRTGESGATNMLASADSKDEHCNQEATENESISNENFSCLDKDELEIFTPAKENFSPNTLLLKSLRKKGKLEEAKHSKWYGSSSPRPVFSPNTRKEKDLIASSNKENKTSRILQGLKPVKQPISGNQPLLERELEINKRRQERVPFQALAVTSGGETRSNTSDTSGPSSEVNDTQKVEKKVSSPVSSNSIREVKKRWTMVVDNTTLLNKESRKSLQLLQGLRGTHLIIPRMVIRELDFLKRRGSLLRRKTEACLALEWIERCMVENSCWIHVQSSAEDGRLTAPTPPASPRSPCSQGSGWFFYGTTSSLPSLNHGSLMDIASPTAEDHILECSLRCRKKMSEGQLVLLSDDVTLKIKAMAEGLICETVQEFRESLMNQFSERFLWVDSSPRGQTWSVLDDVVLREKYNCLPLKKSLKGESAKGLKLILLHNSHYGQRTLLS